jgi:zinc/manganese transport system substrate-binding protein
MCRRRLGIATAILALLGCFACSSPRMGAAASGKVRVVAAENFYGDIAQQIGGRYVSVTSILNDPNADPHLFEPGTTTGAQVADAKLVIENGLGYDAWMDRLIAATPNQDREVVNVAEVLGVSGADANPHLWYDVPRLPQIARAITRALTAADPAHADEYSTQGASFVASLSPLDGAVASIKASFAGEPVAYTEPVPGYLLAAAGLVVKTPMAFARAIEEGNDPTPQAVAEKPWWRANRSAYSSTTRRRPRRSPTTSAGSHSNMGFPSSR